MPFTEVPAELRDWKLASFYPLSSLCWALTSHISGDGPKWFPQRPTSLGSQCLSFKVAAKEAKCKQLHQSTLSCKDPPLSETGLLDIQLSSFLSLSAKTANKVVSVNYDGFFLKMKNHVHEEQDWDHPLISYRPPDSCQMVMSLNDLDLPLYWVQG